MESKIEKSLSIITDRLTFLDGQIKIKNVLGQERTYRLESSNKDIEPHKPKGKFLKLKLNEFVILTPKPIEELIASIQSEIQKSKSKEPPVLIKNPLDGYNKLTDWSLIDFADKSVYFKGTKLDWVSSKAVFNPVREHLKNLKIPYYIRMGDNGPLAFKVENSLAFEILDLGHRLLNLSKGNIIQNHLDIAKKLTKINISLKPFSYLISKTLFKKNKIDYFNYLVELQSEDRKILVLLEPTMSSGNHIGYDLSFLFTKIKPNKYIAIWESTELKKATYIFCFSNKNEYENGIQSL